ncbi:hypothetical protein ODR18_28335, partial [Escherichia coli]|nr:hypothetical protein [Escherichia coli]
STPQNPVFRARYTHSIHKLFTRICEQQNRFAGGWPHCVTPTTITSVFHRASSSTKSEPQRGPRDFLPDESGNGERRMISPPSRATFFRRSARRLTSGRVSFVRHLVFFATK